MPSVPPGRWYPLFPKVDPGKYSFEGLRQLGMHPEQDRIRDLRRRVHEEIARIQRFYCLAGMLNVRVEHGEWPRQNELKVSANFPAENLALFQREAQDDDLDYETP